MDGIYCTKLNILIDKNPYSCVPGEQLQNHRQQSTTELNRVPRIKNHQSASNSPDSTKIIVAF